MFKDLPGAHPDIGQLVHDSSIIELPVVNRLCQQKNIAVSDEEAGQIIGLMTPAEVLAQNSHQREIIVAAKLFSFDALLDNRDLIRDLKLVPKRADPVQAEYELLPKETFLDLIKNHYLKNSSMALVKELYPSDLPAEVGQY